MTGTIAVPPQIRIVLVEDPNRVQVSMSAVLRDLGFAVAGVASNMAGAVAMVRQHNPAIVIANLRLADGDGIQLCTLLLQERGIPIILITDSGVPEPDVFFAATSAGALDVLSSPPAKNHPDYERATRHLARTIRTLSGVRIMARRRDRQVVAGPAPLDADAGRPRTAGDDLIIAVGASTGGPMVVADILRALAGRPFAFAVVVQHMVPEFIAGFGTWLESQIQVPVRLAEDGLLPEKGVVYLAPPKCQIQIEASGRFRTASAKSLQTTHVPSIDVAFLSLSKFRPANTTAVLLTGMGHDGAEGLKVLRDARAFTIVQTPESAVLASMPEKAIARGAAMLTLSPEDIQKTLAKRLADG
ncbi:MAG: chemotaxis protein CheB [Vicinamibacteria bacterium]